MFVASLFFFLNCKHPLFFSPEATVDREDPHKFLFVSRGPNSCKQKKIFYVYGRSLDAKDGEITKPTLNHAMDRDPAWPERQHPNDVYYNITFIKDGNF